MHQSAASNDKDPLPDAQEQFSHEEKTSGPYDTSSRIAAVMDRWEGFAEYNKSFVFETIQPVVSTVT